MRPLHEVPGHHLLRLPDVLRKTGLSRSTLYRLQALRQFPASIRLGVNSAAWDLAEVEAWIAQRIAERDARRGP